MLDGAIAAVVAGPVATMPEEWVCRLIGVDPDDFNHDTDTFSAIGVMPRWTARRGTRSSYKLDPRACCASIIAAAAL
jgi:hypothetical protein